MGIKGLYSFVKREVPHAMKIVNIIEEIAKYQEEKNEKPMIIINLWTLSYYFKHNVSDLLCGYQLNKIKHEFEEYLTRLINAGARLKFVFKKVDATDVEFKKRRIEDYRAGCSLMEKIRGVQSFELLRRRLNGDKFPYNVTILTALIQSARKFGKVYGFNCIKGKPSVQQAHMAELEGAAWIIGLDTYYFLLPGQCKIWIDSELDMTQATICEVDKTVIWNFLNLEPEQMPLYGTLVGDLQSRYQNVRKVLDHFGRANLFTNAARFVNRLPFPLADEVLKRDVLYKIFGNSRFNNHHVLRDFKKTMKSYQVDDDAVSPGIDMQILDLVKDDFVSFAEEILINSPIFVSPVYTDLRLGGVSVNDLVVPWIQKTAGIVLKNYHDEKPRQIISLESHDGSFVTVPIEIIVPEFIEIPSFKCLFAGEMSSFDKMQLLFWVVGIELTDTEVTLIPEEYLADCLILLYLMKMKQITMFEARCVMKTIVDCRDRKFPLSTNYPDTIDDRAFTITFLYAKMYFIFHSCMSSIGMKNLVSEIMFDGVYMQAVYRLNQEDESKHYELTQAEIIDDFYECIRI